MLPQFYVRNLQSPLDQIPVSFAPPVSGAQSLLISISTYEYDELLVRCPPAALRYIDHEDGEIVRVGSSLELAQRLADPVPALARISRHTKPDTRRRRGAVTGNELLSNLSQYHTFDIDPCNDVLKIWTGFREGARGFPSLFSDPPVPLASKVTATKQKRISASEALQDNKTNAPRSDAKGGQWPPGSQVRHHSTDTDIHPVDDGIECRSDFIDGIDPPTVQPSYPKLPSETRSPVQIDPNVESTSAGLLPDRSRAPFRTGGMYYRRPTSVHRQNSPSYREGYLPRTNAYDFKDDMYFSLRSPRTSDSYPDDYLASTTLPLLSSWNHPCGLVPEEQERIYQTHCCLAFRTLEQHQQGSPVVNLTDESQRRPQAAGDQAQDEDVPSNDRCISGTETKPIEYQYQRASHARSPRPFSQSSSMRDTSTGRYISSKDAQDKHQTAGGKSHGRFYSVKNPGHRWSSYSHSRPLTPDDQSGRSWSTQNTKSELGQSKQSTLIEVFDKELAKLSTTDSRKVDDPKIKNGSEPLSNLDMRPNFVTAPKEEVSQSLSDGVQRLSSALQSLNQGSERAILPAFQKLQQDIHTALGVFCAVVKEIGNMVQAGTLATSSGTVNHGIADKLALEKTVEDLEEWVSHIKMQLLPMLQKHVEQSLHKVSKQAVTPSLPGSCNWASASEQPGVQPHSLDADQPTFWQPGNFLPTNDTRVHWIPRGPGTAPPPRLSKWEIGSTTPDPQGPSMSALGKTNLRLPLCSHSSGSRPFAGVRETPAASNDDSALSAAECRFPTVEHFEQDGSRAFRREVEIHPSVIQAHHERFPRMNALQAQKADTTGMELQPPTGTLGVHLPRAKEFARTSPMSFMPPISGYIGMVKPALSSRNGYTDRGGSLQSSTVDASDRSATPTQRDDFVRHSWLGQAGPCHTVVDAQAVHGTDQATDQANDNQSCQSPSQGDRGISDILAEANDTDHCDAATVARTQACVAQLQRLGFGLAAEGGSSRLVIYAQAAEGDLIEAIDMIAEERRAYDQDLQRRFLA
ncbi:MAG: hypothetical protein Q9182_006666 [Xanthomendoza sp. 2 TL-2023]